MKNIFRNKKILAITILVATVIAGLLLLTNRTVALPKIVASAPAAGSTTGDIFKPVIVQFDIPVMAADINISSSPEEIWTIKQESPNSIALLHQEIFHPATFYVVNLSWQARPLPSLSFTTQAAQGDPRLVQKLTDELNRDYPLAKLTPHETPLYRVVYTAPMTLEIELINLNITSQEAIGEVKAWVRSQGGDVDVHKYTVVTGTTTPTN
jgi:hypothetical protein